MSALMIFYPSSLYDSFILHLSSSAMIPLNERLSPDLPRDRGKSIGRDLDVDDEGSKQNLKPLQSLHYNFVGYQSM
jgi:hypothetical protein